MKTKNATQVHELIETAWGWCAVARSAEGICALALPVADAAAAEAEILRRCPGSRRDRAALRDVAEPLERYFNGWTVRFDDVAVDLAAGTPFQQKVWELIRCVPYGQVRTYRWIGMEMGRPEACRAIGAAVGANPVPLIIPCHRIIAEDGTLCGFSAEGGVDLKARMLEMEGLRLHGAGRSRRVLAPGR